MITMATTKSLPVIEKHESDFYIGLSLAIFSSLFIGSSFVIKKRSLLNLNRKGSLRAGAGGFGYLKDWLWWLGLISMGIGELANFTAYAFAPASLVTPLGALSVLVSAVLATKFLNENLNSIGKIGCILCMLGSTVLVIHAPREEGVKSLDELIIKFHNSAFINYLFVICIISLTIIFYIGPKYGSTFVTVYITLCSAVGSVTVVACKALGLAIKEHFANNEKLLSNWTIHVLVLLVVACIFLQMNYLNKALDLFSTSVVTPIYYVVFTTLVIIASAILFKEWNKMDSDNILGTLCGFLIVVIAIYLLNLYREDNSLIRQSLPLIRTHSKEYGSNYSPLVFPR